MNKLTTRFMIATAALVVAASAASAQTLRATIPFEFRAGGRVMAPGTYGVEISELTGARLIRLLNVNSGRAATLVGRARVDPDKAWIASGEGKLVFACTSGSCAFAEVWGGSGAPYAYTIYLPKLDKEETAVLREIPLQARNGE